MAHEAEKMEALKAKYGITDEALYEIADAVQPTSNSQEPDPLGMFSGLGGTAGAPLPSAITQAMKGDLNIAEALILMYFMDRMESKQGGGPQQQDTSLNKEILDELREERQQNREYLEKIILGKRVDDSELRAQYAEKSLEEERAAQRQRDIVEGAVRGAVDQIGEIYGSRIDALAGRVQGLPEGQKEGFWDELFGDFETDLKGQFKGLVLDRLKPPAPPIVKTDEEGKHSLDFGEILNKGENLLNKYIDSRGAPPPKVPVRGVDTQPGGPQSPSPEGPAEEEGAIEADFEVVEEEPTPEPVVVSSPIPPEDIAGIGPSRAQELEAMGINDARQLTQISPSHLADQLGITKEKAEDIVKQAQDFTDQA